MKNFVLTFILLIQVSRVKLNPATTKGIEYKNVFSDILNDILESVRLSDFEKITILKTQIEKLNSRQPNHTILAPMVADYISVLKYWFNVNDLIEIKAEKYAGNNLV